MYLDSILNQTCTSSLIEAQQNLNMPLHCVLFSKHPLACIAIERTSQ